MKLLKNAVVATTLALSLGSFSTTTSAEVCLGMACMYNRMSIFQLTNESEQPL